ncbi:MAG: hypothetical protein CSA50_01050 [Gammaproteobacteria bacterium]|nr:MAG: hypothetical protein CSA50_01050 [Gammaproteobacteria bacterium]
MIDKIYQHFIVLLEVPVAQQCDEKKPCYFFKVFSQNLRKYKLVVNYFRKLKWGSCACAYFVGGIQNISN